MVFAQDNDKEGTDMTTPPARDRFELHLVLTEDGKIQIRTEGPGADDRMDPIDHAITWDGYVEGIEHGVEAKLPPGDYTVHRKPSLSEWVARKSGIELHTESGVLGTLEQNIMETLGKQVAEINKELDARAGELMMANREVIGLQQQLIGALGVLSRIAEAVAKAPDASIDSELRGTILDELERVES